MAPRNSRNRTPLKVLGLSFLLGSLLLSSACGTSTPRPINVSGSWFWVETDTSVIPHVVTDLHATLNQSTRTLTGTKFTATGASCAITGVIHGKQLQGKIGAPCNQTFAVSFVPASKFPPYDFLSGWVSDSRKTILVFAPLDHTSTPAKRDSIRRGYPGKSYSE